ncbi:GNAT family N-acetyltransferase [Costertonia aggregata]|uniref:GNAT family N-acetyltransferase n=1 Tax=Costertonia aggregata TaxID=343403 RepID=A0A7H9AUP9_9FLAO|nr:hypothetical protein [Costertonia aggregata]QLG47166.1 hypothetical protein HYG79_17975 [Costertonia aggregata]
MRSRLKNRYLFNREQTDKKRCGSTRFGLIDTTHKVLHIGWTWIAPETRGTGFNHQMKF